MNLKQMTRFFFQKATGAFSTAQTETRNRMKYNALFMLDPDVLVRHLAAFAAGDIAGLEHVIDEFESRDDKMKIGAFKMSAAVASKPWEIRINKGEEENERARLHKEVLTRFWNRIRVTDAFCRNRRGGVRMLVKQMMSAQSRVYAVHDVTWKTRGDGELEATFTQIPAWCFENRTGELRYIEQPGGYTGVPMKDGEWLVTVGEGVGVTASILAMAKRLSWNDWLLFSEKCGMPVILANTNAQQDTPAWKALEAAVAAIAPKTGLLADNDSKIQAVPIGGSSGQTTYRELVETVDRAISSLYRGGDLATMSMGGEGVGTNAQEGESELMDGDGCAMIGETLQEQIERHVIRFTCGDFEPLAGIVINPPAETEDIDREIKIDQHLGEFGVKLSKKDMLSRYGRTEAADETDAATRQANGGQGLTALPGFANEKDFLVPAGQNPQAAGQQSQGQDHGESSEDVLKAFAKDTGPAADAIKELLKNPSKEAAEALMKNLGSLMPDDLEMAAVIAEAMAKEFGTSLANEQPRGKSSPKSTPGSFAPAGGGSVSEKSPKARAPRNDGKIDFHGRTKSKQKADKQCRALGYRSVDDMMEQSTTVDQSTIDKILQGGDFTCKPHEAIAALRSLGSVETNVPGEAAVKLNERSVRHYVCGDRRGGEPDVERLREIPRAVDAMRHSTAHHWELDDEPIIRIDKEPLPEYTQTVYEKTFGSGKTKVYAYTDNGVLNGWQLNP